MSTVMNFAGSNGQEQSLSLAYLKSTSGRSDSLMQRMLAFENRSVVIWRRLDQQIQSPGAQTLAPRQPEQDYFHLLSKARTDAAEARLRAHGDRDNDEMMTDASASDSHHFREIGNDSCKNKGRGSMRSGSLDDQALEDFVNRFCQMEMDQLWAGTLVVRDEVRDLRLKWLTATAQTAAASKDSIDIETS